MLHIKRRGSVVIVTMFMLFIVSIASSFLYKLSLHNSEIENLYCFNDDKYNLSEEEEDVLYKFMENLNSYHKESDNCNEDKQTTGAATFQVDSEQTTGASNIQTENDEISNGLREEINTKQTSGAEVMQGKSDFFDNKLEKIGKYSLEFDKEKDIFNLKTNEKSREIKYKIRGNHIILIPTIIQKKIEQRGN